MTDFNPKQEKNSNTQKQNQPLENVEKQIFSDLNQSTNPFLPTDAKSINPFIQNVQNKPNPFLPADAKSINPFIQNVQKKPNPFLPADAKSINPFIKSQANEQQIITQNNDSQKATVSNQDNTIQRKIKTKDGIEENKANPKDSKKAKEMKQAKGTFLLLSKDDLKKIEDDKIDGNTRVLSPHKHIIGEKHSQSRFQEAVNDWGWGAQRMVEDLATNKLMPDVRADKARENEKSKYYQALPLEDTIAKELTSLLICYTYLNELLRENRIPEGYKDETIGKLKSTMNIRASLFKYWKNSYNKNADDKDLPSEAIEIKNILLNYEDHKLKLDKVKEQLENDEVEGNSMKEAISFVERLINIMREVLKQNHKPKDDIDKIVDESKEKEDIIEMNPVREHYMGINIKDNLQSPGLVKVGDGHLEGLEKQNIPEAEFYNDYIKFEKDTYLKPSPHNID